MDFRQVWLAEGNNSTTNRFPVLGMAPENDQKDVQKHNFLCTPTE
jgi:hypothetical protein